MQDPNHNYPQSILMLYQETAAETTASIFQILSRTSTLHGYLALVELDLKRATLEEIRRLLKLSEVRLENKRQLIANLTVLGQQAWVSDSEKAVIQDILKEWN